MYQLRNTFAALLVCATAAFGQFNAGGGTQDSKDLAAGFDSVAVADGKIIDISHARTDTTYIDSYQVVPVFSSAPSAGGSGENCGLVGRMYFNSTTGKLQVCDGDEYVNLGRIDEDEDGLVATSDGGIDDNDGVAFTAPTAVAADILTGHTARVGATLAEVSGTISPTVTGNLVGIDGDLVAGKIKDGVTIFGVEGTFPSDGDAVVGDVLTGKYFYTTSDTRHTGTMTNVGAQTITPTTSNTAITQGYHSGSGYAAGDANLVAAKIKDGEAIFGVTGTFPSDGDAIAANVRSGKYFYSDTSSRLTGSMGDCTTGGSSCYASGGEWQSSECGNSTSGTQTECYIDDTPRYATQTNCSGANNTGYCYMDGASKSNTDTDLTAANIKSGINIFGFTGTHVGSSTLTGNAAAAQVRSGYTFYSNDPDSKLTGTVANCTQGGGNCYAHGGIWSTGYCAAGQTGCYASGGKWYSSECGTSTTGAIGSCYESSAYITNTLCTASGGSYCYMNTSSFAAMDADLIASNFVNTVTVFGVTGSLDKCTGTETATVCHPHTPGGYLITMESSDKHRCWVFCASISGIVSAAFCPTVGGCLYRCQCCTHTSTVAGGTTWIGRHGC